MATDDKAFLLEWLNILASGPAEAWHDRVADNVVIRLPFAPPGVASEIHGLDQAIALMSDHWRSIERFDWHDVVIYRTEEKGLFLTTARSQVKFQSGNGYSNEYVMMTRVRSGRVIEHSEYFNPMPVMAMVATTQQRRTG